MATGSLYTASSNPLPLDGTVNNLFEHDTLLALFFPLLTAAINAELAGDSEAIVAGSAWAVAAAGITLPGGDALASKLPVQDRSYLPPTAGRFSETQPDWPVLCIYHVAEAESEAWSTERDLERAEMQIDWIMPALDAQGEHRLGGAPKLVARVVRDTLRRGSHPAYNSGAPQFSGDPIWELAFGKIEFGPARMGQDGQGMEFLAASIPLTVSHLVADATPAPLFLGADYTVNDSGGLIVYLDSNTPAPQPLP